MNPAFALVSLFGVSALTAQIPANYQLEKDWLVEGSGYFAQIISDKEKGTLTLGNGLLERTIDCRLGTTVRFKNLMTGESIIRAVDPEGSLTIGGITYYIGGGEGQPNKAFLTTEWLEKLSPKGNSLTLTQFEIGKPCERLKWKRVRHHAPDSVWPPKGASLRLDYKMPQPSEVEVLTRALQDSDFGRQSLFSDGFSKLDPTWKIHASKAHPRSGFENEGKPGEIQTPSNTSVYAERPIPEGTHVVEATIHPGTDTSSAWGPGIALVYKTQTFRFNLRPGGVSGARYPVLGLFNGTNDLPNISGKEGIDLTKPITLRIRMDEGQLSFDARQEGREWRHYYSQDLPEDIGPALLFRVGKMNHGGGGTDHSTAGEPVRLRINKVGFYAAFDPEELAILRKSQDELQGVTVSVHYEIYDGIPALCKWITVANDGKSAINLDKFNAETLSVVENDNTVEVRDGVSLTVPRCLHVETDMAFGGFTHENSSRHSVHWHADESYKTQVNYELKQPCLLQVEPSYGPDQTIGPGQTFKTFHVFEMAFDSEERERRGLAIRRMYRVLAPWVTENPLMLHCASSHEPTVGNAIDQAAETGFEMVILSFGSGFNSENDDPDYLATWKRMNDYALSKGIHLGSYSLYASRSIGGGNDIVSPPGQRPTFGSCPAITSRWGIDYMKKLFNLFDETGFMVFENDGPYPGDVDVTARLPLQKGMNDSQWVHWQIWTDFYKHLRGKGVYMNLPDYYFMSGSNKCGMGYREVNWSLPREQQSIHTRQNIYDGTWKKTPSMGWMFIPLTQYHGGGAAATIEPLHRHLDHYELMMRSNLGLGVQAAYRGHRLYDTEETRNVVKKTVDWYKQHRAILESDLIHGRRADGIDIDWMLHVNPALEEKAFLSVYNPTDQEITKEILVPLYYSGLKDSTRISANGADFTGLQLDPFSRARWVVTVPAQGYGYYIFQ